VRRGPAVERRRAASLEAALDELEAAAREVARTERPGSVDLRFRHYEAHERVAARVELAGPGRVSPSVRAGVDVHGDGSMVAHVGRTRRAAVPVGDDETALQALRRILTAP
jgi:hypothetical protein